MPIRSTTFLVLHDNQLDQMSDTQRDITKGDIGKGHCFSNDKARELRST